MSETLASCPFHWGNAAWEWPLNALRYLIEAGGVVYSVAFMVAAVRYASRLGMMRSVPDFSVSSPPVPLTEKPTSS